MTKKKEIFEKLMNCANMFEDMGKSLQTASELFLMKFLTDNQDFFEEYYPLSEGKRVFRTGKDFNYLYRFLIVPLIDIILSSASLKLYNAVR